jgi:Protein of unknown function (DUF3108)
MTLKLFLLLAVSLIISFIYSEFAKPNASELNKIHNSEIHYFTHSNADYFLESNKDFYFFSDKSLKVGEELTYVVKYSFLKLGEIKLKVTNKKVINGKTVYITVAYIDSYKGVPFVNLHQIYESFVNTNYYSNYFRGTVKGDEYDTFTDYYFNYDSSKVRIIKGKIKPHEVWVDSTTELKEQYDDGLSIFYFARMNSGENKTVTVPTFVNEKKEKTVINFYDEISGVSIDSIDYKVACVRLDGEAQFVSIYGLTGYFEGWFSDDEASIPILAKMHVIIGNVTVELIKWKREGWTPPKFNE